MDAQNHQKTEEVADAETVRILVMKGQTLPNPVEAADEVSDYLLKQDDSILLMDA